MSLRVGTTREYTNTHTNFPRNCSPVAELLVIGDVQVFELSMHFVVCARESAPCGQRPAVVRPNAGDAGVYIAHAAAQTSTGEAQQANWALVHFHDHQ